MKISEFTPRHKSNLAKALLAVLQDTSITLDMAHFATRLHKTRRMLHVSPEWVAQSASGMHRECGTTCCVIGYGRVTLSNEEVGDMGPYMRCETDPWGKVRWGKFVNLAFGAFHSFVFSECWPNDREQAAKRGLLFLQSGGEEPIEYTEWSDRLRGIPDPPVCPLTYLNELSIDEVKKELQTYILPCIP